VEKLAKIQAGTDRAAAELAIQRLRDEIRQLFREIEGLSQEAVKRDPVGIQKALCNLKLFSTWSSKGVQECMDMLCGLHPQQAYEVATEYRNQATFKTKRIEATAGILHKLHDLKVRADEKQKQVDANMRIVEGT
jgi:hypothetical protein